jgi:hypothetical protein
MADQESPSIAQPTRACLVTNVIIIQSFVTFVTNNQDKVHFLLGKNGSIVEISFYSYSPISISASLAPDFPSLIGQ